MNKKRKARGKGWRNEPIRHGLASQGVKTKINSQGKKEAEKNISSTLPDIVEYGYENYEEKPLDVPPWEFDEPDAGEIEEATNVVGEWLMYEDYNNDERVDEALNFLERNIPDDVMNGLRQKVERLKEE